MRRLLGLILAGSMTLGASGCMAATKIETRPSKEVTEELPAAEVRPQDDYYYYINKGRVENATFGYGETLAASAFDEAVVEEEIYSIIRETVSGSGYEKGSEEDIIKRAYQLYMDYDFGSQPAPQELVDLLNRIDSVTSVSELMEIDAELYRDFGISSILNLSLGRDIRDSGKYVLMFSQIRSFLTTEFKEVREDNMALDSLVSSGKLIRHAMGSDTDSSEASGRAMASLAFQIYGVTDQAVMDDLLGASSITTLSTEETYGNFRSFDLKKYLLDIVFSESAIGSFNIQDEKQFRGLSEIFTDENIDALKTWELGRVFEQYRKFLVSSYEEIASFVQKDYSSSEEQALHEIREAFYQETDPIYVERYYSDEMDAALISMCEDIKDGYRNLIRDATWLSADTRLSLLTKLDNIFYVTGKDLARHDASEYADLSGDSYYEFLVAYNRIDRKKWIESFSSPVDKKKIDMPMQMMNACYDTYGNRIIITVAIMNAPFFDLHADYYTNLGGIGAVISHEMGHAFDSNGILFNMDGIYDPSWISEEDRAVLEERNKKAAEYFEKNFTVFGLYHVDGKQTLGENYADLGGMECLTSLAGSDEELTRIFENYARIWCEKKTDTSIINQIAYDEHSPEVLRVNAILSTLDAFYKVYEVKEGDGMYIAPDERISRWYE